MIPGELNIVGDKERNHNNNIVSYSRFYLSVLRVGNAVGFNGPIIFIAEGNIFYPSLTIKRLYTKYVLPVSYFILVNN